MGVPRRLRGLLLGVNDIGQLGRGFTSAFEPTAARVAGVPDTIKLSVGRDRACALDAMGVPGLPSDLVDVSAAFANSCAITSSPPTESSRTSARGCASCPRTRRRRRA